MVLLIEITERIIENESQRLITFNFILVHFIIYIIIQDILVTVKLRKLDEMKIKASPYISILFLCGIIF